MPWTRACGTCLSWKVSHPASAGLAMGGPVLKWALCLGLQPGRTPATVSRRLPSLPFTPRPTRMPAAGCACVGATSTTAMLNRLHTWQNQQLCQRSLTRAQTGPSHTRLDSLPADPIARTPHSMLPMRGPASGCAQQACLTPITQCALRGRKHFISHLGRKLPAACTQRAELCWQEARGRCRTSWTS